ncbi:hypothetical protein Ocin01_11934, partial [Orchesella cincta]
SSSRLLVVPVARRLTADLYTLKKEYGRGDERCNIIIINKPRRRPTRRPQIVKKATETSERRQSANHQQQSCPASCVPLQTDLPEFPPMSGFEIGRIHRQEKS